MESNILGFGEIMLRLNPPQYQKIRQTAQFQVNYGGAEANVIMSLSCFGHQTKFVSKVPNNQLGISALQQLNSLGVDTAGVLQSEGRLGIYFLEQGHGTRTSEVIYDRANSCFAQATTHDFDYDELLQGVTHLCISGITPALSPNMALICEELIITAKSKNIFVSYDSNYRAKLWSHQQARKFIERILPFVDAVFLGVADFEYILNYPIPIGTIEEQLEQLYSKLVATYPNVQYAAATKRTVYSMSENALAAVFYNKGKLYVSPEQRFQILDRVGGGDAFTAGILHGIICEEKPQKIVEFATCASILKHSVSGDVNLASVDEVEAFWQYGTQAIKR